MCYCNICFMNSFVVLILVCFVLLVSGLIMYSLLWSSNLISITAILVSFYVFCVWLYSHRVCLFFFLYSSSFWSCQKGEKIWCCCCISNLVGTQKQFSNHHIQRGSMHLLRGSKDFNITLSSQQHFVIIKKGENVNYMFLMTTRPPTMDNAARSKRRSNHLE